ncbi:hypothetical protein COX00_03200 [Candidatus Uhrbacteria bacterium CG22_combo_CG10-13_8_21_14_all_47_17]|uniref:Uncharacterized protein n=1 Tax=Candidatus Uhrbacteria bacterium CG22_combo_CG10-13_8_21_14_all_47_17 TaxID=1975041 RepID=A0A2H0BS12_9BACT|nr:MAG: hypothetical protein COX00_03200 [Candidatus Uhrbacteria bacterium CG22_combo_CG10-13_8_21_14_all_47_17]
MDFAGFAVFVAAIVAGKDTVKEFAGWSRKAVLYGLKEMSLWRHHRLVTWLRPALIWGLCINGAVTALVAYFCAAAIDDARTATAYWSLLAFAVLLLIFLFGRWWSIKDIKPLSVDEVEAFLAVKANLAPERQEAALADKFGKRGVMGLGTLLIMFGSYAFLGVGIALFSSVLYDAGVSWGAVLVLKTLALALFFLSVVSVAVGVLILGSATKFVGGAARGVFRALWDSIVTALPNIEGEEAKELLPDLQFGNLWKAFVAITFSGPGTFLLSYYACQLLFPGLSDQGIVLGILVLLGITTQVSKQFGNDVTERVKRAGRVIALLGVLVGIYRIIEHLAFSGHHMYGVIINGTAGAAVRHQDSLQHLGLVWWNGLTGMGACAMAGFLLLFGGVFLWLLNMKPESKVGQSFRWVASTVLGLAVVAALIGVAASLAGVDTQAEIAPPSSAPSVTAPAVNTEDLLRQSTDGGATPHERVGGSPATLLGPGNVPLSRRERDANLRTIATATILSPSLNPPRRHSVAQATEETPTCDSLREEGFVESFVQNEASHGRCTQ